MSNVYIQRQMSKKVELNRQRVEEAREREEREADALCQLVKKITEKKEA